MLGSVPLAAGMARAGKVGRERENTRVKEEKTGGWKIQLPHTKPARAARHPRKRTGTEEEDRDTMMETGSSAK